MTTSRTSAPAAATGADVVVVGAGMGGLVVAHELARAGRDVVVVDAAEEVGGLLRRGTLAGVDIDLGAESFATRTDAVATLVADAGLDLELVAPRPQGPGSPSRRMTACGGLACRGGPCSASRPTRRPTTSSRSSAPTAPRVRATSAACPSPPTRSRRCTTWSPNVSVSASPIGSSTRSAGASTRDPPPRPACRSCTPVCGASSSRADRFSRLQTRSRPVSVPAPPSAASQGACGACRRRSLRPRRRVALRSARVSPCMPCAPRPTRSWSRRRAGHSRRVTS